MVIRLAALLFLIISSIGSFINPTLVSAIYDPTTVANNPYGIHLISPTADESVPAGELVNSSGGDWGYVTILITRKDKDQVKWQKFFDDLRQRHLIPLVRLATEPEGENWKRPDEGEEKVWADFLDSLNWPTKNRYVIIYNEPNHSREWGGSTDPASYAQVLDKTISALKAKNPDFFVLNAGLDASTPHQVPDYHDEIKYLQTMAQTVPGIFDKLDGWVSHSYPNPGFVGSPDATGRGTVRTWEWELAQIKALGATKNLPVFITETGWQHSQGITENKKLPNPETVGKYLETAFKNAWNNHQIVAVTPFLLNYQDPPFVNFSFKKYTGTNKPDQVLAAQYPEYHEHYQAMANIPKGAGKPIQINQSQLLKGEVYHSLVSGEKYRVVFTFKNTGQSIWNEAEPIRLEVLKGQLELDIVSTLITTSKVHPGEEASFVLTFQAPSNGQYNVAFNLYNGHQIFDQAPLEFTTNVQSPVSLQVKASLLWKKNFSGEYNLKIVNEFIDILQKIVMKDDGNSNSIGINSLVPDYTYDFTLNKPFYKPKTIRQTVSSGENTLDFGTLEPDISSAILKPQELWQLLPFAN